ncbi:hypothetical protein BAUCODRAFT_34991 [Baudoinia panamericana UAMH 10762]|uniref:Uncharacterized protein n=1 Tax=Baudoinia panamericana (strain UAMH 10762) TaxID=717646 RepID=M2LL47_BAUPA|nr:uncharacterized protein BAUCODRAFT_34991 [Baudoinia panamericana UAMH 10762]EMC94992.1 hypothetical protein BAUCODRAFT_34991 [Baudoinia panamericana UAMH 10762]
MSSSKPLRTPYDATSISDLVGAVLTNSTQFMVHYTFHSVDSGRRLHLVQSGLHVLHTITLRPETPEDAFLSGLLQSGGRKSGSIVLQLDRDTVQAVILASPRLACNTYEPYCRTARHDSDSLHRLCPDHECPRE